ncbi:MAG: sulfite exporter TauE/SafE family protein [Planctomycetota bacterium]|nr:sulfite exporter TauE/SafE family protein [Planctomycetota bacterium]
MLELFAAVFLASVLGSVHCLGMCGPFAALASAGSGSCSSRQKPRSGVARVELTLGGRRTASALHAAIAYNVGRAMTYLSLGALAGGLGAGLNLAADELLGVQRGATVIAGAGLLFFGVVALARLAGVRWPGLPLPKSVARAASLGHQRAQRLPPTLRALAIGLLTTLIPCGWLYAFVITAAGTASPLLGLLTMGAFWLGTLPAMLLLGAGVRSLASILGASASRHVPLVTALALIAVGVFTLSRRIEIPLASAAMLPDGSIPVGLQAATEHARTLDASEAPCCNPELHVRPARAGTVHEENHDAGDGAKRGPSGGGEQ